MKATSKKATAKATAPKVKPTDFPLGIELTNENIAWNSYNLTMFTDLEKALKSLKREQKATCSFNPELCEKLFLVRIEKTFQINHWRYMVAYYN